MGSYRVCMCFTRQFKVAEVKPPADVQEAFKKYAGRGTYMSADQLRRFLVDEQGESEVTLADAEAIVQQILQKRHHHIAKFTRQNNITLEDFFHFLFSVDLNPPILAKVTDPFGTLVNLPPPLFFLFFFFFVFCVCVGVPFRISSQDLVLELSRTVLELR